MHKEVKKFVGSVRENWPRYFIGTRVLEVGSRNINGSVRSFFSGCDYTGLDLEAGDGVDFVCHAKDWPPHERGRYDVVISTEALEHDKHWKQTLVAMYAMLREGGLMIITCASVNREEHGTTQAAPEASPATNDYYRNLSMFDFCFEFWTLETHFEPCQIAYARGAKDLNFWGIKRTYTQETTAS